jgi:iron complex transport system ATP-binding protein
MRSRTTNGKASGALSGTTARRAASCSALSVVNPIPSIETERHYVQLSGGERQRVHIARALVQLWAAPVESPEAKLFLLDEPTASLDPAHQVAILRMVGARARDGWTVVVVLHDLNLAAAWCDEVVLMRAGRIYAKGTPADVMTGTTLSAVYGCRMVANTPPDGGEVYVLPHHIA